MNSNELSEFWARKWFKIYVVRILCTRNKSNQRKAETRYVRVNNYVSDSQAARTIAANIALEQSIDFRDRKRLKVSTRLADPVNDLECTRTVIKLEQAA